MDHKTAALAIIAASRCEISNQIACKADRSRSPYAKYLADRWCMPCVAQAGLDGELPPKIICIEAEVC